MKKIFVIGIGPGGVEHMTKKAVDALRMSDVVVGYKPYLEYVNEFVQGKELFSTGMTGELERCNRAIGFALEGKTTSIVSTGDAGLYGMAGPILELVPKDIEVEIVPGVSAEFSAAAELGAPIMHDVATISLSDLLTPFELVLKRIELASEGDFVIAIYNPRSKGRPDHLERALEIVKQYRKEETVVGYVKNSGRQGTEVTVTTLGAFDCSRIDMMTVVIIGNSKTRVINGRMVTPRGYEL